MNGAALLAAALFAPAATPASIDFGAVQLGDAAPRLLRVQATDVTASGAGFSAALAPGGVLIVFEPYERGEPATGTLTLRTSSGTTRIKLRGIGIDTVAPRVTVEMPDVSRSGKRMTIRFSAIDNDLVTAMTLEVRGKVIGRLSWPASTYRWIVPAGLHGHVRITVSAVDRAGNRASATSKPVAVR
ncbi:MAG: hypothetical protein QOF43_958 [Gaiellaceae bacterium]|nr:hypothetical protein [Gaiellaceae bacterium]